MVDKLGPPIFMASNGFDGLEINRWQASVKRCDQIMPHNIQAQIFRFIDQLGVILKGNDLYRVTEVVRIG